MFFAQVPYKSVKKRGHRELLWEEGEYIIPVERRREPKADGAAALF